MGSDNLSDSRFAGAPSFDARKTNAGECGQPRRHVQPGGRAQPGGHAQSVGHVQPGGRVLSRREFIRASTLLAGAAALGLPGIASARNSQADTSSAKAKPTYASDPEERPSVYDYTRARVTFSAVGDNLIHMPLVNEADYNAGSYGDGLYDFTPMYQGVFDILETHDLNFIDIETILGGDDRGFSGYPVFNSPSCLAEQITSCGWNLATTATNHCLDMGFSGIVNSSQTWAQYPKMTVTGTYVSQEDRDTIRVVSRQGIRFAFLAYTDYLNGYIPPSDSPWCVAQTDFDEMTNDVQKAHELADFIIVAMSWGSEYAFSPNSFQRECAQHLANLEVDLIVGFGPHVIQPIEWYEAYDSDGNPTGHKTLIVFSLGNFLSNQPNSFNNVEGCFTCAFERANPEAKVEITDLKWTPLVNHINTSSSWHQVFQLKDYTDALARAHQTIGLESDPLGYCYSLTEQIIGPSGVEIDW